MGVVHSPVLPERTLLNKLKLPSALPNKNVNSDQPLVLGSGRKHYNKEAKRFAQRGSPHG